MKESLFLGLVFFSPSFLGGFSEFPLPSFYSSSCLKCAFYRVEYLTELILHTGLQTTVSLKVNFFRIMNVKNVYIAKSTELIATTATFGTISRLNFQLAANKTSIKANKMTKERIEVKWKKSAVGHSMVP